MVKKKKTKTKTSTRFYRKFELHSCWTRIETSVKQTVPIIIHYTV